MKLSSDMEICLPVSIHVHGGTVPTNIVALSVCPIRLKSVICRSSLTHRLYDLSMRTKVCWYGNMLACISSRSWGHCSNEHCCTLRVPNPAKISNMQELLDTSSLRSEHAHLFVDLLNSLYTIKIYTRIVCNVSVNHNGFLDSFYERL